MPANLKGKLTDLFDDPSRELVSRVIDAMIDVPDTPLKDYLDDEDVVESMKLLAAVGKLMGIKAAKRCQRCNMLERRWEQHGCLDEKCPMEKKRGR